MQTEVFSLFLVFSGQQTAGGKDILPPGCPDGGREAAFLQHSLESLHVLAGLVGKVRDSVKTDQVDAALQVLKEPD